MDLGCTIFVIDSPFKHFSLVSLRRRVERRLPVLSTYLGHVRPDDTYWYLTACPELMGQVVERLERRWRTPK